MKTWYTIGVIVIAALVLWYFYGRSVPTASAPTTATEQTQGSELTAGNTTADIANDLNETLDGSAALNADAVAAAEAVQGL